MFRQFRFHGKQRDSSGHGRGDDEFFWSDGRSPVIGYAVGDQEGDIAPIALPDHVATAPLAIVGEDDGIFGLFDHGAFAFDDVLVSIGGTELIQAAHGEECPAAVVLPQIGHGLWSH